MSETPVERPAPVSHDFVGSQACVKCHAEIVRKYAGHPMAQAMASVHDASPVEKRDHTDFSTTPALSYFVEHEHDQVFHHEVRKDAAGNVMYDQRVPIHFAVGSGRRGRTYLTNDSGRLSASMVSWFTEGDQWNLSPGYHPEDNERFERRVTDACLGCHSGEVAIQETEQNRY